MTALFRKKLGTKGEDEAVRALKAEGYRIVERNWRGKGGEIDVIATDGKTLAFIEVKTRSSDAYGAPYEAVTRKKQDHIVRASREYMNGARLGDNILVRFDIVSVTVESERFKSEIIKDAFEVEDSFQ